MNAFLKLIRQKDFNNISIDDITQEAKINRSTFHYRFMDKYDLMKTIQKILTI